MFKNPYIGLIITVIAKLIAYVTVCRMLSQELDNNMKSYEKFGILADPTEKE